MDRTREIGTMRAFGTPKRYISLECFIETVILTISGGIIQYICEDLKSYCLFATHIYELTKLENKFKNFKNYYVGYKVKGAGDISMTYKVSQGKIDSSLGVELFKALGFNKEMVTLLDQFQKEEEEKQNNK